MGKFEHDQAGIEAWRLHLPDRFHVASVAVILKQRLHKAEAWRLPSLTPSAPVGIVDSYEAQRTLGLLVPRYVQHVLNSECPLIKISLWMDRGPAPPRSFAASAPLPYNRSVGGSPCSGSSGSFCSSRSPSLELPSESVLEYAAQGGELRTRGPVQPAHKLGALLDQACWIIFLRVFGIVPLARAELASHVPRVPNPFRDTGRTLKNMIRPQCDSLGSI